MAGDVARQGNRLMYEERHEGVDGGGVTCCMCCLVGLLDGFRFSLERNWTLVLVGQLSCHSLIEGQPTRMCYLK